MWDYAHPRVNSDCAGKIKTTSQIFHSLFLKYDTIWFSTSFGINQNQSHDPKNEVVLGCFRHVSYFILNIFIINYWYITMKMVILLEYKWKVKKKKKRKTTY
jgi:hypothetical protein